MAGRSKKINRPSGLDGLIGFQDEPRPSLRDSDRWVPMIWIGKSGRSWIIELDPFEGSRCSKYLTPLGAAAANHIAFLGDAVFNSALGRSSHSVAINTRDIQFQDQPTSYMQFKAGSLNVACTVATRLLFLPDECYTELGEDYLPDDPIHRILSAVQRDSATDVAPLWWP
jgi:hypothetical protein